MGTPDFDSEARAIIETVRTDTRSGAAQLAASALQRVRQWLSTGPVTSVALDQLLTDLAEARPSMVPLANAIERCRQGFGPWQADSPVAQQALPVVDSVLDQLACANRRVADAAAALIPAGATLFTHSRSSQVLALFRLLVQQGHDFSVICTQSSPGNEGFTLARELDELGVPVTVIPVPRRRWLLRKAILCWWAGAPGLAVAFFLTRAATIRWRRLARGRGRRSGF